MASENHATNIAEEVPGDKGKGKAAEAVANDTAMDEDDDSSSSDEGEEVSRTTAAETSPSLSIPAHRFRFAPGFFLLTHVLPPHTEH